MSFYIDKFHFNTDSLLDGLPKKEFRELKVNMIRREFKTGKSIFKEKSYPTGIYIMRKGKVKIFKTNKEGGQQIVYIYCKGEIMGYRSILSNEPHPVSAVALENVVVSFIPREKFLSTVSHSLDLSNRLLRNMAHEFTVWTNTISVFAMYPVRERVALSLLVLNEKYRRNRYKNKLPVISISRDDLAQYVGTAKETLIRMLQDFKQRKMIRTSGRKKIVVLKPSELEKITKLY
ncbi:MAG: Crp/Fnr family transcriptional regulator [Bacteroidia bacterium]|nr:Crp/Fnr family transcriptional regulator [Bacteroidia bacterium]